MISFFKMHNLNKFSRRKKKKIREIDMDSKELQEEKTQFLAGLIRVKCLKTDHTVANLYLF